MLQDGRSAKYLSSLTSASTDCPPRLRPTHSNRRTFIARKVCTSIRPSLQRFLLKGLTNLAIARELRIAEGTVKQHVHAIYKTIGVSSRAELLALAGRGGIRRDGSPIIKET